MASIVMYLSGQSIGKRNFWSDTNSKPPWWPSGIPFTTPNGKGGRDRLNGTELVAIAEAMLAANPDAFQCQEQTGLGETGIIYI